ncbi:hypothetical protein VP01_599g3 [Puccinia sorghi]|uniref:ribonuclease H n=1 Tax=Puccinia sorghi TaxID=27349 RepID=A0A0L6UJK5_9BASI|nr:hypothetical protein VP01_599g3 [Puccinia sorghi]
MIFSCKQLTPPSFIFGGLELTFPKSTRWLGIILDQKLTFSEQVQKIKKIGNLSVLQLSRIVKSTYGLNPGLTRRLVLAVVYARVLFGSIAWYTRRNAKGVKEMLDGIYNQAARLITGLFKQTPLVFVKKGCGLKSLTTIHLKNTHSYILKALTYPSSHPIHPILRADLTDNRSTFPSVVQAMLLTRQPFNFLERPIETILPSPLPPWVSPVSEITNLGIKRTDVLALIPQQVEKERRQNTLVIFTDGSWIPSEGAGAAAVVHDSTRKAVVALPNHNTITNFETELIGIHLAIKLAKEMTSSPNASSIAGVAIFSDNQGALINSTHPIRSESGQALALANFLDCKTLGTQVRLYWSPGHEGLKSNEKADSLARSAAHSSAEGNSNEFACTLLPASLSKLRQTCGARILQEDDELQFAREDLACFGFRKDPLPVVRALDCLERGLATIIHQLRANNAPLKNFLFKIKATLDPRCPTCGVWETAQHFLMFCTRYRLQRQSLKKRLRRLKCGVNPDSFRSIMDNAKAMAEVGQFVLDTQRFPNIRKYLP